MCSYCLFQTFKIELMFIPNIPNWITAYLKHSKLSDSVFQPFQCKVTAYSKLCNVETLFIPKIYDFDDFSSFFKNISRNW